MCDGSVEGRVEGEWEMVFEPDCSNVRVRATRVDAGGEVVQPFRVAPCEAEALPRYEAFRLRVRVQVAGTGADRIAYAKPFTVSAE
jgi:hypothetical protein